MSSTLTPRHGSWAPWVIHIFLVCSVLSFLSSATMSLAVIYFVPQVACNAQSARRLAFAEKQGTRLVFAHYHSENEPRPLCLREISSWFFDGRFVVGERL